MIFLLVFNYINYLPAKALSLINFGNSLNQDQAKDNRALSGSILFETLIVILKDNL